MKPGIYVTNRGGGSLIERFDKGEWWDMYGCLRPHWPQKSDILAGPYTPEQIAGIGKLAEKSRAMYDAWADSTNAEDPEAEGYDTIRELGEALAPYGDL